MKLNLILRCLLFLIIAPSISWANLTTCKLEGESNFIKAIAWDDKTKTAKVTDDFNNSHDGKVSFKRKYNKHGQKINIFVKHKEPYYGSDADEYIIFPVSKNSFRVVGVGYIFDGKQYHLNSSQGNYPLTCLSM